MKVAIAAMTAAIVLIGFAASAQVDEVTIDLSVNIRITNPEAPCNKALAVLTTARTPEPMSEADARAFVSIEGTLNTTKCLEVIFSELSSPTNGYAVVAVQSGLGR